MSDFQLPSSRYILPSFVERTSYGMKESNPYNKLFEERIIFLGVQIDDASANDVMAQLITLESADPDRDITIYINSPGGSFTSLMAIYDTMMFVRPDIQTVCMGQADSAAGVLLAAGTPGRRRAPPYPPGRRHHRGRGRGGRGRGGSAGGRDAGQAAGAPVLPGADPPALRRGRRPGVGPGDPRRRDRAGAHADGGDPRAAHRTDGRADPLRHRPRQDPDGERGQGVRHRRPGHPEPEAQRAPHGMSHVPPVRYREEIACVAASPRTVRGAVPGVTRESSDPRRTGASAPRGGGRAGEGRR